MSDVHTSGQSLAPPAWVRATRWIVIAMIGAFAAWCVTFMSADQSLRDGLAVRESWLETMKGAERRLHEHLAADSTVTDIATTLESCAVILDQLRQSLREDGLSRAGTFDAIDVAKRSAGDVASRLAQPSAAHHSTELGRVLLAADAVVIAIRIETREMSAQLAQRKRTLLVVGTGALTLGGLTLLLLHLYVGSQRRIAELSSRHALDVRAQHSQKLESLGLLAGGIAHDFNNLLVGILGNADLARSLVPPDSTAHECVDEISTTAKRCADLSRQMLAYSGQGHFQVEPLDLNRLIAETAALMRASVSKRCSMHFDLGDGLPPVEADATQIRQVVMNLITNASEAITDQDGSISLATSAQHLTRAQLTQDAWYDDLAEGTYVSIEVSDNGVGMDELTQAKIFDPFFTTKVAGRGLGLAAVLGIVRAHKGRIRLDSHPGRGTTFRILLPATARIASPVPPEPAPQASWEGQAKVLLVDDDAVARSTGERLLRQVGFVVSTAPDGRFALQLFGAAPDSFACVLLDVTMPHMDGHETLRELRRIRADIPVIMSSGYERSRAGNPGGEIVSQGFLRKPYGLDELRRELAAALDTRRPDWAEPRDRVNET